MVGGDGAQSKRPMAPFFFAECSFLSCTTGELGGEYIPEMRSKRPATQPDSVAGERTGTKRKHSRSAGAEGMGGGDLQESTGEPGLCIVEVDVDLVGMESGGVTREFDIRERVWGREGSGKGRFGFGPRNADTHRLL